MEETPIFNALIAKTGRNKLIGTFLFQYKEPPVVWDMKGSTDFMTQEDHVHSPEGRCLKNRFGKRCN